MNKILFAIGFVMLVLPLGLQFWDTKQQEELITTYQEQVENVEKETLEACLESANDYNTCLYEKEQVDKSEYEEQLNVFGNGVMGSIEIPKIDLKLPIGHGTGKEVLASSVGHMKESSLPVGGENTHSVLAGHRGSPNAQLFTRLDELEIGDVFYINVCNRNSCYQVQDIQVVEPENAEVVKIQEGRDLVSLVTCTPYGLNTHRLVITGERVDENVQYNTEIKSVSVRNLVIGILSCLFLVAAGAQIMQKKRRKRMKKYLPLLVALIICFCPLEAFAASGNIEVQLPEGWEGKISCSKVGNMVNGFFVLEEAYKASRVNLNYLKTAEQMEEAAKLLLQYEKTGRIFDVDEEGSVLIPNLEEGVYLIHTYGDFEYEISPTLVYLPTWMEAEQEMLYDVTVIPKYSVKKPTPDTGWDSGEGLYFSLIVISLIIIVGLSCHNRFKCGKITFKYSETGGSSNGNDNDTENPRCPRRIGFGGCRSIN